MFGYLVFMSIFLFFLGAAVGSFLNVVIYRTVQGESWLKGRSKCDHCRKKIAWFDNIPIISFLFLKRKARCCGKPIPISYPIVEFMTGTLFVWWYLIGFLFFKLTTTPFQLLQPLFWLVVGVLLLTIFFADLMHMIIPDKVVGTLFIVTLIYRLYLTSSSIMQVKDLQMAVLGMILAVVFLGGLWLVTKGRGMGLGDVKLAAPVALILGWPKTLVGLFFAFILGGMVAMVLLVSNRKKFGQVIPFGPFIIAGAVLSLIWGDAIFNWYVYWL